MLRLTRAKLAALVARIRELPAPQREALVKRELEGRSHEEIAEIPGRDPRRCQGLDLHLQDAARGGVGMLIPMPVLRALLDAGPQQTEAAGLGIGGAAAGLSAGGGGAIALKASAALVVGALAVGSGGAMKIAMATTTAATRRPSRARQKGERANAPVDP